MMDKRPNIDLAAITLDDFVRHGVTEILAYGVVIGLVERRGDLLTSDPVASYDDPDMQDVLDRWVPVYRDAMAEKATEQARVNQQLHEARCGMQRDMMWSKISTAMGSGD